MMQRSVRQRRQQPSLFLFLIAYTFLSCIHDHIFVQAIFHMKLQSSESKCIFIPLPTNEISVLSATYQLLNDNISTDPIQVLVFSEETNEIVYDRSSPDAAQRRTMGRRITSSSFTIEGRGRHEVCIGNGAHLPSILSRNRYGLTNNQQRPSNNDGLDRSVGFTFHVRPLHERRSTSTSDSEAFAPMTQKVSKTIELSQSIVDNLSQLADHMEYVKEREHIHRNIVESIFERLWKWTLLEISVLIVIAVVQVLYWKTFFGPKLSAYV